jgi:hypothetical protein
MVYAEAGMVTSSAISKGKKQQPAVPEGGFLCLKIKL